MLRKILKPEYWLTFFALLSWTTAGGIALYKAFEYRIWTGSLVLCVFVYTLCLFGYDVLREIERMKNYTDIIPRSEKDVRGKR